MLSCLSRGVGLWTGDYKTPSPVSLERPRKCKSALPRFGGWDEAAIHRHGVTVTPTGLCRAKSAASSIRTCSPDGELALPKTYLTRKGALLLFSTPGDDEYDPLRGFPQHYPSNKNNIKSDNLIDLSLNIGTVQRLTTSVLQYGDKNYDPASCSVSEMKNGLFLKFLKSLPEEGLGDRLQPGSDLSLYLDRLKSTTNPQRFSRLSSPEVQELKSALEALDQSCSQTPVHGTRHGTEEFTQGRQSRPFTAPLLRRNKSSRNGVLSTEKLAASLKSSKLIDRTAVPSPPPQLAWNLLSGEVTNYHATTQSKTQQDSHRSAGSSVSSEYSAERRSQGEINLDETDSEQIPSKITSLDLNCPHAFSDNSVENRPEGNDHLVINQQELSPVLESPESALSDVCRVNSPESQHVEHSQTPVIGNVESQHALHRRPSLLEILTAGTSDEGAGSMEEGASSEKPDSVSLVSASLLGFEEEKILLSQERETNDVDSEATRLETSALDVLSPPANVGVREVLDVTTQQSSLAMSPASEPGVLVDGRADGDISTAADEPAFPGHMTPVLRSSSPIERPAPASSPVCWAEDTSESLRQKVPSSSGEGKVILTDDAGFEQKSKVTNVLEDERDSQHRQENILSSGEVEEVIHSHNRMMKKGNKRVAEMHGRTGENETHSQSNIKKTSNLIAQSDAKVQQATEIQSGNLRSDQRSITSTDIVSDRALTGTPISELSEFKALFTNETKSDSKPSPQAHSKSASIHISSYKPCEEGIVQEDIQEPVSTVSDPPKAPKQIKDTPFTSKSSLRSIRSGVSPPASPPPPPTSRADSQTPSSQAFSPRPPSGAPPQRSGPIRKAIIKDVGEIRPAPPSPETLVRSLKSAPPEGRRLAAEPKQPKVRTTSAASKKSKRSKSSKKTKVADDFDEERMKEEEKERARRKLEEKVKLLEQQIRTKETLRQEQLAEAEKLRREYQLQLDTLEREAEELRQAEEDAKASMAMTRRSQREEREHQRKAELERKKELAIQRREREKKMLEAARAKELEMLESIADAGMRRSLMEDMAVKRDEEERLATERFEEEMKEAQILAEDQEDRMRDLERQAEEEAMQRLLQEQDELEQKRLSLLMETRRLDEEDQKLKQEIESEQLRLEAERRQIEEEDWARQQQEAERLRQLEEQEAFQKEQQRREADLRKLNFARQRRKNMDMHMSLEKVRTSQGVTRPYIFSYFTTWPREIYEKPMGVEVKKKRPGIKPKPKSAK